VIARILCPLSLSDVSRGTFDHALALGKWYQADVIALHVFATWIPPGSLATYPGWMRHVPEARALIDRELGELMQPAKAAGVDVPLTIREGDPASAIVEHAASISADVIVMGAHPQGRFDRLSRGSVAEKVVRKARCAVLVAPARESMAPSVAGYRRIISAIDFSDCSQGALAYALSIAGLTRATVTLLHVVGPDAAPPAAHEGGRRDASPAVDAETARGLLRATAHRHEGRRCAIETVVRAGASHQEIVRTASELDADLLVMGARGRRVKDPAGCGSTTTQVVRRPPCAVLTVRTT
jgi:nucleotide-binding universal stress UspA family protein